MKDRNIEELWKNYEKLLSRLCDENINNLVNSLGQRIAECSISLKKSEPFCGYGGLLEYSLELAKTARAIASALNYNVPIASIIKVSLLSGIGYIGSNNEERLKQCNSEWHKEKLGQLFDWNENCRRYAINHMSLYYINNYKISLTWEEFITINFLNSSNEEDSKFYGFEKPELSTLLLISKEAVLKKEKDIIDGVFTLPF